MRYGSALQEDFHTVEQEDAALTGLADLIRVEKFELADTFVVIILDTDAAVPLLDFAFRCPKTDIDWLRTVED